MRFILWLTVWLRRLVVLVLLFALAVVAPIGWVELACRGKPVTNDYTSLLPEESRRDESRTYTTYPEWHIVHAYEDYADVLRAGDPHQFGFFSAIKGFWGSTCDLAKKAAEHGGFTTESKQTIYTIGASFTAEMMLKGAYEETLGRVMTLIRGSERTPLDELSATQAQSYAEFLRQTPWYKWDFGSDASALWAAKTSHPRDWERAIALGIENGAKQAYAGVIATAVDSVTGPDELTIRSIVSGLSPEQLAAVAGVTVIGPRGPGIEIETPRYAAFTAILKELARQGAEFNEIAGYDDIILTVVTPDTTASGATPLYSFPRPATGDYRHLLELKVWGLANRLREFEALGIAVEHIHDY